MVKTIYLNEETEKILKEHRHNNPQFNLSQFVQKIIRDYNMEGEKLHVEKAEFEIKNIEIKIQELENRKQFILARIESQRMKELDEKKIEEIRIEDTKDTLFKYCNITEIEAHDLAMEYFSLKNRPSLTKFIDDKKIEMRNEPKDI